jgi:hypothetical protein
VFSLEVFERCKKDVDYYEAHGLIKKHALTVKLKTTIY